MTKEEYLNMYKEDKLAEICARLEEERDYYHDEMNAYKSDAQSAQKKVTELSSYWESMDKLSKKLETLPAKDFIELYYRMQAMINNHIRYINTCISNYDELGSISNHTSKPEDLRDITAIY